MARRIESYGIECWTCGFSKLCGHFINSFISLHITGIPLGKSNSVECSVLVDFYFGF